MSSPDPGRRRRPRLCAWGGRRRVARAARPRAERVCDPVALVEAAEARERRRLAERLHAGPLQELAVARQELLEARDGRPAAVDRACDAVDAAIAQLRGTLPDLHPLLLGQAGLARAIEAVAREQARRASLRHASVEIGEDVAGCADELLFGLARELLLNVARHAAARDVRVSAFREASTVRLAVVDDGRGIDLERRAGAVAGDHLGLAAIVDRVGARGGRVLVHSSPVRGTAVEVVVPVG